MRVASAVLIAAGLAVGLGALVLLHVLPTGLSPLRNAVSQYGISEYRVVYRVQTLAYGVAGVGAAGGVATLPGPVGIVVALCATLAVARGLISWSPMDAPAPLAPRRAAATAYWQWQPSWPPVSRAEDSRACSTATESIPASPPPAACSPSS